jgi:hypothetical protein
LTFPQDIAKQKECKKEEPKVVSIPQDIHIDRVSLRTEPMKEMNEYDIKRMLAKHNFFDSSKNISGSFDNYFVDNNDGTVTDMATMLMWKKSGSIRSIDYDRAKAYTYIKLLKRERFAGYSDWRLPTLEELASLLEKGEQKGVHIDPVFGNMQIRCWTVDQFMYGQVPGQPTRAAWIVIFQDGKISKATWGNLSYHKSYHKNYTKAVRSAK